MTKKLTYEDKLLAEYRNFLQGMSRLQFKRKQILENYNLALKDKKIKKIRGSFK